jgi:hypothetical protein
MGIASRYLTGETLKTRQCRQGGAISNSLNFLGDSHCPAAAPELGLNNPVTEILEDRREQPSYSFVNAGADKIALRYKMVSER